MAQGRDASDVAIVTTSGRIYWKASEMLVICTPAYAGERTQVNSLAAYQPVIGAGLGDLGHSCAEGECLGDAGQGSCGEASLLSFELALGIPSDNEYHSTPMAV